jgi:hypothetical protein
LAYATARPVNLRPQEKLPIGDAVPKEGALAGDTRVHVAKATKHQGSPKN